MNVYSMVPHSPGSDTTLALHSSSSSEDFETLPHSPIKGFYIDDRGRSYVQLLSDCEAQQEEIETLRKINEEQAEALKRLDADLFSMTRRYLLARERVDELQKSSKDYEARLKLLSLQNRDISEEASLQTERSSNEIGCSLRGRNVALSDDSTLRPQTPRNGIRSADHSPVRFHPSTILGERTTVSDAVATTISPDVDSESDKPHASPEDITKLVRSINIQILEIARTCIASVNLRSGARAPQVDNKMITNVTNGVGFVLLQMLRGKDHSKDRTLVELALQTILVHHVAKIVDSWPFPTEGGADKGNDQSSGQICCNPTRSRFSSITDSALDDIVTIFSLCGSPVHILDLKRKHEDRVGSTVDALFKTAQLLAGQVKCGPVIPTDAPFSVEYRILHARPGTAFNKDAMQRQGPQSHGISMWKSTSKKVPHILCTRDIGVACLRRSTGRCNSFKEREILLKPTVVFESEVAR